MPCDPFTTLPCSGHTPQLSPSLRGSCSPRGCPMPAFDVTPDSPHRASCPFSFDAPHPVLSSYPPVTPHSSSAALLLPCPGVPSPRARVATRYPLLPQHLLISQRGAHTPAFPKPCHYGSLPAQAWMSPLVSPSEIAPRCTHIQHPPYSLFLPIAPSAPLP